MSNVTNAHLLAAINETNSEIRNLTQAITALLSADMPAKVTAPAPKARKAAQPKAAKPKAETPEWIIARAQRKQARREAAAWMRSKGLTPNGPAWEAVMAGERNVARLRKLAA